MRIFLLPILVAVAMLAGCTGTQSFSCNASFGSRGGGEQLMYSAPPTRNAAGYLHC